MEVLVLVWILGVILCGVVAGAKHRSIVGWGLASFLFSPLLVLLALIAVPTLVRGERLCDECRA